MLGRFFFVFPSLTQKVRALNYVSVVKLLIVLRSRSKFFKDLLVQSVKHLLHLSISDLPAEIRNFSAKGEVIRGYEEYSDLWKSLCDLSISSSWNEGLEYPNETLEQLQSEIHSQLISEIFMVINILNLKLLSKSEDVSADTLDVSQLIPVNQKDFDIFLNLVSLCSSILPTTRPDRMVKWSYIFIENIIDKSNTHPLVSGFYKLGSIISKICKDYKLFNSYGESNLYMNSKEIAEGLGLSSRSFTLLKSLLVEFTIDVVSRITQYQDELLQSCVEFVMSCGVELLEIDRLIPVFEKAISLSQS